MSKIVKRVLRLEDLAERLGHGPTHTRAMVSAHAKRYGIAIRTARDDHKAAHNILKDLSKDRVSDNHSLMEAHQSRVLGRAELAYTALIGQASSLLGLVGRSKGFDQEELEVRAIKMFNAAANMLRSMAPVQARMMRLQGLGRPEALADIVDTLVVFAGLPFPESYEGDAAQITTEEVLDGIDYVEAEFTEAN